jgi:hypothetical protein
MELIGGGTWLSMCTTRFLPPTQTLMATVTITTKHVLKARALRRVVGRMIL